MMARIVASAGQESVGDLLNGDPGRYLSWGIPQVGGLWDLWEDTQGHKLTDEWVRGWPRFNLIALLYLADSKRTGVRNSFLLSMIEAYEDRGSLTTAQTRGVMNILIGNLRGARRRFWCSRDTRTDAGSGRSDCVVCGGPLVSRRTAARGAGDQCYRRVLGDWS